MTFDPSVSLRIVNNDRLRRSHGWGQYRDLGGALALTSDAPTAESNRLEGFTSDDLRIEGLLDIGFALLRAFDCEPAVLLTPLDRPPFIRERLGARGLVTSAESVALTYTGNAASLRRSGDVEVRRVTPEDAVRFADVLSAGAPGWARKTTRSATLEAVLIPENTHYLAHVDGEPVGTMQLLVDGATAGIYATATLKAYRRRGVCSTLLAQAIDDARQAGCDLIALQTAAAGDARRLFESAGFSLAHASTLWTAPRSD